MVDCENKVDNHVINSAYEVQAETNIFKSDMQNKASIVDDLKENNYFEIILQDPNPDSANELFIDETSNANENEPTNSNELDILRINKNDSEIRQKPYNSIQPNFEPFESLDAKDDEGPILIEYFIPLSKLNDSTSTKLNKNQTVETKESVSYLHKLKTIYDTFQTTSTPINASTTTESLIETQPSYSENATSSN
jgi:hypothetical protein